MNRHSTRNPAAAPPTPVSQGGRTAEQRINDIQTQAAANAGAQAAQGNQQAAQSGSTTAKGKKTVKGKKQTGSAGKKTANGKKQVDEPGNPSLDPKDFKDYSAAKNQEFLDSLPKNLSKKQRAAACAKETRRFKAAAQAALNATSVPPAPGFAPPVDLADVNPPVPAPTDPKHSPKPSPPRPTPPKPSPPPKEPSPRPATPKPSPPPPAPQPDDPSAPGPAVPPTVPGPSISTGPKWWDAPGLTKKSKDLSSIRENMGKFFKQESTWDAFTREEQVRLMNLLPRATSMVSGQEDPFEKLPHFYITSALETTGVWDVFSSDVSIFLNAKAEGQLVEKRLKEAHWAHKERMKPKQGELEMPSEDEDTEDDYGVISSLPF